MASANDADMSAMNNLYKPNNANWVQGDYGAAGAWSGGYNPHWEQSQQSSAPTSNPYATPGGDSSQVSSQNGPYADPSPEPQQSAAPVFGSADWQQQQRDNAMRDTNALRASQGQDALGADAFAAPQMTQPQMDEQHAYQTARDFALGYTPLGNGSPGGYSTSEHPAEAYQQFMNSGYDGKQALADGWNTGVGQMNWYKQKQPTTESKFDPVAGVYG